MDPEAMRPFGAALRAYHDGDGDAELTLHRDDGLAVPLPAAHFFRDPDAFSALERLALRRCRGRVLDVGAGSGLHSLSLQEAGLPVTAIDICAEAVTILRERGVAAAHCADVFDFAADPFDTILMLGHGIGMVETLEGLDRFLARLPRLLAATGQVVLDSLDVTATGDPVHLEYHAAARAPGRYVGETRIRCEFRGMLGPYYGWLHVDPSALATHAAAAGWTCEVLAEAEGGNYLARLGR